MDDEQGWHFQPDGRGSEQGGERERERERDWTPSTRPRPPARVAGARNVRPEGIAARTERTRAAGTGSPVGRLGTRPKSHPRSRSAASVLPRNLARLRAAVARAGAPRGDWARDEESARVRRLRHVGGRCGERPSAPAGSGWEPCSLCGAADGGGGELVIPSRAPALDLGSVGSQPRSQLPLLGEAAEVDHT